MLRGSVIAKKPQTSIWTSIRYDLRSVSSSAGQHAAGRWGEAPGRPSPCSHLSPSVPSGCARALGVLVVPLLQQPPFPFAKQSPSGKTSAEAASAPQPSRYGTNTKAEHAAVSSKRKIKVHRSWEEAEQADGTGGHACGQVLVRKGNQWWEGTASGTQLGKVRHSLHREWDAGAPAACRQILHLLAESLVLLPHTPPSFETMEPKVQQWWSQQHNSWHSPPLPLSFWYKQMKNGDLRKTLGRWCQMLAGTSACYLHFSRTAKQAKGSENSTLRFSQENKSGQLSITRHKEKKITIKVIYWKLFCHHSFNISFPN